MWTYRSLSLGARFASRRLSSAVNGRPQLRVKDIPGPKALPFIGNTLSFLKAGHTKRHHEYIDSLHKKYGPIVRTKIGPIHAIYVSDPELMRTVFLKLEGKHPAHILPEPWLHYNNLYNCKRGLLFMDGEEWLHNRRIMNKLLLKSDCDSWLENSMKAAADQLIRRWNANLKDGSIIPDLDFETYRLSIDAIISVFWGTGCESSKNANYESLVNMFARAVQNIFLHSAKMYVLPANVYEKIGTTSWRGFKDAVNTSIALGTKIVSEILDSPMPTDGLIHRLRNENMNRDDIKRIAVDFILAAGDTTAITTQWTLYLLSKNGSIAEEARTQFGESVNFSKNNHLKAILKESMRMYPVAPFIARFLPQPSLLGDYQLDSGTLLVLSTYTSGRDTLNFHSPNDFLPQRWFKLNNSKGGAHVPYATMPFAMGARSCIGKKLAMLQLCEVIGSIIRNYEMTSLNDKDINLVMKMVSVPSEPVRIKFTPRQ